MNAPCSPFLMTTCFGPRSMIHRAAFTRLNSSVSWRASASLSVIRSTRSSSFEQIGAAALDPEVHRVARHELRLGDLRQHIELQARIDVAEKDERRVAKLLGNLRAEIREHAEVRLERLGGVEVVAVASAPAERRALRALEAGEIDRPRRERLVRARRSDSRRRSRRRAAPATDGSPTRRRTCRSRRGRCRLCRTAFRPNPARRNLRRERSCQGGA